MLNNVFNILLYTVKHSGPLPCTNRHYKLYYPKVSISERQK